MYETVFRKEYVTRNKLINSQDNLILSSMIVSPSSIRSPFPKKTHHQVVVLLPVLSNILVLTESALCSRRGNTKS